MGQKQDTKFKIQKSKIKTRHNRFRRDEMKILITYATTSGSTRSIAERIQARIAAADFGSISLEPMETKASVDDFDAIIIGSCIHAGSWMRKGKKFIKNNATALRDNPKPTWAFSVGMPKQIALEGHKLFYGAY